MIFANNSLYLHQVLVKPSFLGVSPFSICPNDVLTCMKSIKYLTFIVLKLSLLPKENDCSIYIYIYIYLTYAVSNVANYFLMLQLIKPEVQLPAR